MGIVFLFLWMQHRAAGYTKRWVICVKIWYLQKSFPNVSQRMSYTQISGVQVAIKAKGPLIPNTLQIIPALNCSLNEQFKDCRETPELVQWLRKGGGA